MIRELIRKGRVENSIYELQNLANRVLDEHLKERVQRSGDMLSHNYNLTKWKFNMGVMSSEDWSVFQAKTANSILDILKAVNDEPNLLRGRSNCEISFSRIIIDSNTCCWINRTRDEDIENPIYDFHEQMNSEEGKNKIIDPIFDVAIINNSLEPTIINYIGINPISARSDIKGIPVSGRIEKSEGYVLQIKDFIFGKDELLRLDNPIYMESKAPFRFTLQLQDYKKNAIKEGNDTVIKIIIGANNRRIESPLIKMGMY